MLKSLKLTLRISPENKKEIVSRAKKTHLNVSEYMIVSAINKNIIVIDGFPKVVMQISRIGNNINQIVKLANTTSYVSPDQIAAIKNELKSIQNVIYDFIKSAIKDKYKISC